ncbi:MAG: phosphoheptose isomerase [Nitrospirae bacterium RIFOXYB2_FULL_43_5]|nr:MAG: phosphoheptose isomerase [Nitrospirae bacterium GWF2_44_13]OGW32579.1 MAG: phosphoheptose isomerase [Nitrospirae bacterium GWD2_44_7]OGW63503.1 MAG: phosphoheptose isomerase [Nitrospirae bacterium RIFOXYA2_FULL_44_9]OGW73005.1 MAG: phosphoheptose isomerase [Nitrospirae bacterium RIFOXYB2_FULL_43_5]OGW73259.1 MAG: phosphoheptose isomerase [Nitrospirae bacterium RIFOXYC2_FULL_44_7]
MDFSDTDRIADCFLNYNLRLQSVLLNTAWDKVALLAQDVRKCWLSNRQVFLCGNGGSAANAMHIANDFLYGIAIRTKSKRGLRVVALPANQSVLTCLGNDIGYENIFSYQLSSLGGENDLLIALSGSGNSPNIVNAILEAKRIGMKSYALLGFSGGRCKDIADVPLHFPVDDMQISEDIQLIIGHMVMQWLKDNPLPEESV